jgi:hypothetical protein
MIWKVKPRFRRPSPDRAGSITVVSAGHDLDHEHHGFLIISPGIELDERREIAGITIFGSSIAETVTCFCSFMASMDVTPNMIDQNRVPAFIARCSTIGPERQRREEGETADDQDHADHEADEQAAGGRQRTRRRRESTSWPASEPASAIAGMIMKKRPTNIELASVRL